MIISRVGTVSFWTLMLACLFSLLLLGWRTYMYCVRLQLPIQSVYCGVKSLCYVGFIGIGLLSLKLSRNYQQEGFFRAPNVRVVQAIGWLLLAVSVLNSVFNVLRDILRIKVETGVPLPGLIAYADQISMPPTPALFTRFALNYLFEAPPFLFLSLLVFLFAGFMERAIAVKRDDEGII